MRRISASLIVLAAAGCASAPPAPVVVARVEPTPVPPPPAPPPPTIERTWRLNFVDGITQQALTVTPTLTLGADAAAGMLASGFSGCAEFKGAAPLTGISIRLDGLRPNPAPDCATDARSVESLFVSALTATRRLTIRGGFLVLIDENGRDRAYFEPG